MLSPTPTRNLAVACALAALTLAALPAAAAPLAPSPACAVRGFTIAPGHRGTNIRAAPSRSARVIGHLPAPRPVEGPGTPPVGVDFDIIDSAHGWMKITDVGPDADYRIPFKGTGWVAGSLVSATLGDVNLRARPDPDAKVVARLYDEAEHAGPDAFRVRAALACNGDYLEVLVEPFAKGPLLRGWTFRPCVSQLTTCDRGS